LNSTEELLRDLRRISADNHRCFGCGREHNCSTRGCRIIRDAMDLIRAQASALSDSEQARAELGQRLGLALSKLQDVEQAAEALSRRLGAASAVLETAAQDG
jgi:hypothetical protein